MVSVNDQCSAFWFWNKPFYYSNLKYRDHRWKESSFDNVKVVGSMWEEGLQLHMQEGRNSHLICSVTARMTKNNIELTW